MDRMASLARKQSGVAAVALAALLAPAVLAAEPPASADAPKPVARFGELTFPFGTLHAGSDLRHEFVFYNDGRADLQISQVRPACNPCVSVVDFTRAVAPGQKGQVTLVLNTAKMRDKVNTSAWVFTNDPDRSKIRLSFVGEILHPVRAIPEMAYFPSVRADEAAMMTLDLLVQSEEPVTLLDARTSTDRFAVSLTEKEAGRKYALEVRTVPPMAIGRADGWITVKTDRADYATMEIQACAIVQPRILATPTLFYVPLPTTQEWRGTVMLYALDQKPLKITRVTAVPEGMQATVAPLSNEQKASDPRLQAQVHVSYPEGRSPAAPNGQLVIEIDDPEFPKITVPILFRGQNRAPEGAPEKP